MKIKVTKKSSSKEDSKKRPPEEDSGSLSWMITNREAQKQAQRKSDALSKRDDTPQEIWMRDGETRSIQFCRSEPLAALWRYGLKQGKMFSKFTAPAPGEPDLFKKAGLKSQLFYIYCIRDIKGYVDKKGKKWKNIPRYLVAGSRIEKQIEKIREKKGDLTKLEIEMSRSGEGTDTTYSFFVEDKIPFDEEGIKCLSILKKAFQKKYRPLEVEEQRTILGGVSSEDED